MLYDWLRRGGRLGSAKLLVAAEDDDDRLSQLSIQNRADVLQDSNHSPSTREDSAGETNATEH